MSIPPPPPTHQIPVLTDITSAVVASITAAITAFIERVWPSRENDTIVQLETRFQRMREEAAERARAQEEERELRRLAAVLEAIALEQQRLNAQDAKQAADERKRVAMAKKREEEHQARTPMTLVATTSQQERPAGVGAGPRNKGKQRAEDTRMIEDRRRQLAEAAPMAVESGQARRVNAEDRKRLQEQKARIGIEKAEVERRGVEQRERKRRQSEHDANNLANGIQPSVWPTEQEYLDARTKIQYSPTHFSFAIAGVAGSGKSSLINIFLGLPNYDPGAARTDVVETTSEIRRYPDRGEEPPRKWTVWYDIPGAGTLNIPGWQYFNQQCLFVFDLVIVLVGDRMTQVDLEILKNAKLFDIPTFIVRSKADQYIRNSMKSDGYESGDDMPENCRAQFRRDYIRKTRQSFEGQLRQAGLPKQRIYLVSCSKEFRAAYAAFTSGSEYSAARTGGNRHFIDEQELIHDLMHAAAARRCDMNPRPIQATGPREVVLPGFAVEAGLTDQVCSQITTTPFRRTPNIQGGTSTVRCDQCPPHLARFSSVAALQTHLASGAHLRASGSSENSNPRTGPEGQGSARTGGGRAAKNNARKKAPPPPVDLVQWAQSISQTLAGSRPSSFSIEMLQEINSGLREIQRLFPHSSIAKHTNLAVLVLSPTKVVATQIFTLLEELGTPINVRCWACVGGTQVVEDQRVLATHPHVVSGTPGRVADLIKRRFLRTKQIKILVLNMDSKLLTQDFRAQMHQVHSSLPQGVQIVRTAFPAPRGRARN